MTNTLEIQKLTKQFNEQSILRDITFSVEKGEVLSIVGPSGSGKTTLLRILAGLEPLTTGTISISGQDVTEKKANKRSVSLVFQQPLLFPHMTVEENIRYGAKLAKKDSKRKTQSLLEAIGLLDYKDYYPAEISGGQQQRVALARAMATEPEVILFDEPFSSLDPQLRKELRLWVRTFLTERSITSIFVTHDTEEAMLMGDRVAVFHEGKFQQVDQPSTLLQSPNHPFVAHFLGGHLVIDEERYIPVQSCLFRPPSDTSYEQHEGTIQHKTYQHGQTIGHLFLESLGEKVSLPVQEGSVGAELSLYLPLDKIKRFEGGRT
ncbi:ABC transporter ATP-binding protein [Halobacillus litoralis]|uniref:ABC transporter ATP-binding protein n=1 Tax=Halobacillus litoralis TaxID=45668 RepID=UPI001CD5AC42|nr:ABC transporter ATP-binding protein [Halobacillus litoralis]MCA0972609.1 ABC transporter ATP-binding protein [Halobacillus litoralis]